MRALATLPARTPLAAGLAEGSISAAELGTVVIGGLFSSTFLTLIVVPVVYSLVEGGKGWFGGLGRRPRAATDGGDPAAPDPGMASAGEAPSSAG